MRCSTLGSVVTLTLALLCAPLTTDAQPPKQVPRIGVLHTNASALWFQPLLAAFRQGLRDLGYVEGQTSSSSTGRQRATPSASPLWQPSWSSCRWR